MESRNVPITNFQPIKLNGSQRIAYLERQIVLYSEMHYLIQTLTCFREHLAGPEEIYFSFSTPVTCKPDRCLFKDY